jgi:drug/metabolite transporter (DMT)-like permease
MIMIEIGLFEWLGGALIVGAILLTLLIKDKRKNGKD